MILFKKHNFKVLLLFLFLIHAFADIFYLKTNALPPAWDQSLHLKNSLTFYRLIKKNEFTKLIKVSQYYPPFFYLSTVPLYFFGETANIALCVNLFYLVILMSAVFLIGKSLFNEKVGFLSTCLISFYPAIISIRRTYLIDFSLTSLIALSIYFLIKANYFKNLRHSVFFGLSLGISMLTKWTAVFFLIFPLLNTFFFAIKQKNIKLRLKNALISFLLALFVLSIWYLPNFKTLYPAIIHYGNAKTSQIDIQEEDAIMSLTSKFTFYIKAIQNQVFLFSFILIPIFVFIFFKKNFLKSKIFLLGSIFFPYLVFSIIQNKDIRYTLPLLIFVSLISALGIFRIKRICIRNLLILFIFIAGIAQLLTLTFGYPRFEKLINLNLYPHTRVLEEKSWQIDKIFQILSSEAGKCQKANCKVIVLPDHPYVNGLTYQYFAFLKKLPIEIHNAAYIPNKDLKYQILNNDYIVLKSEPITLSSPYFTIVENAYNLFQKNINEFEKIKVVILPDNSNLIIYRSLKQDIP